MDDPYIIADVGRLQIDLHAAHEVLLETGRRLCRVKDDVTISRLR